MKKSKLFAIAFYSVLLILLSACSSSESSSLSTSKEEVHLCPKCHMEVAKSHLHSSSIKKDKHQEYFDDIGCMILWSKENNIDLTKTDAKVFSNDTQVYISASSAHYKMGEKTPMSYGFSAYEKKDTDTIDLNEVIIKMLRGEHMANPKIRKQLLKL